MKSVPKVILTLAIACASALLTLSTPTEQPTEIHVRIMDSRTHRPLKERKIQITFSGMDGQWYHNAMIMTANTGSDGVAVFLVKQPIPPRLGIVDLEGYPCSRPEDFPTQEILENGVVASWPPSGIQKTDQWCTPGPQAAQPQKRAGEVVFFVHPLNMWQNFWFTLLK
jgi:hypothetical protein